MRIEVNGKPHETGAATLGELLAELGLAEARVATAVNGAFAASDARGALRLADGDRIEVLRPMAGG